MKTLLCSFCIILGLVSNLFAQIYEGEACNGGTSTLKNHFKTGNFSQFEAEWDGYPGSFSAWCSSHLKASGKAPLVPDEPSGDEELDNYIEALEKNHRWSCMYSPEHLKDNNPKTAWVEGAKGQGLGEIVILQIDVSKKLEIWGGYGKSESLFRANSRPKEIKVYVLQAMHGTPTQAGFMYRDFKILGQHQVTLDDKNSFQPLALPAFEMKPLTQEMNELFSNIDKHVFSFVAIEIVSVYEGNKYDDTCISEIRAVD